MTRPLPLPLFRKAREVRFPFLGVGEVLHRRHSEPLCRPKRWNGSNTFVRVNKVVLVIPTGSIYNFGSLSAGTSLTTIFTIRNAGNAVLELTGSPVVQISEGFPDVQIARQPSKHTLSPGGRKYDICPFIPPIWLKGTPEMVSPTIFSC